jgi:DNA end-binding protein Ku
VLAFVPSEQIDPMLLSRSYFLEPAGATPRAYVLLAKTLAEVDRTAVVLFTLRQKTRLAALRVRDGVLVLQTLLWPDEVRPSASFRNIGQANAPTSLEIEMAQALVESMAGDFNPADFADDYQIELKKLLVSVADGGRTIAAPKSVEPDREVEDLVAALQRSFEEATKPD